VTADLESLLTNTADRAMRYARLAAERPVAPHAEAIARLESLAGPLPEQPSDAGSVLALLDEVGSPATVTSTGGRYFGYVTGGVLPAALAANWLAGAWDQNAGMATMSPVAARLEVAALEWLRELLGLPITSAAGLVTGATMANFTGLAAARRALLSRAGWNVEEDGLFDAPSLSV
jgi:glutamate/tyrosine decarboxylase-like PLP-dependent enzyme